MLPYSAPSHFTLIKLTEVDREIPTQVATTYFKSRLRWEAPQYDNKLFVKETLPLRLVVRTSFEAATRK